MIYQATITTPANTLKADQVKTILAANKGLVYKVEVYFPPGSSGTHHCLIADSGFQCWPTTPNEYFSGDRLQVEFDDPYIKDEPPYEFQIYTYNTDTTEDRLVFVRIGLVIKEIFMARFLPTYTYEYFLDMLGKLKETQETDRQAIVESPFSWLEE